uniref:HDC10263 n=1 Tax=Drosophila melanogaster TaxID=7227 RepID=Q6IL64_DROME|nr:TPA_inf: HDC10263 [Drosophila melanogaster]
MDMDKTQPVFINLKNKVLQISQLLFGREFRPDFRRNGEKEEISWGSGLSIFPSNGKVGKVCDEGLQIGATHSTSSLLRSQSWLCSHHRHHPTSPLNPLITADLQATHPPSHPLVFRCCTFLASLQSCKSFEYLCNSSNQTNGPTHSIHHSKSRPQQPPTTHISGAFCNSCSSLVALTHFQKSRVIIGLADICLKLAMFKSQKWWWSVDIVRLFRGGVIVLSLQVLCRFRRLRWLPARCGDLFNELRFVAWRKFFLAPFAVK